MSAKTYLQQTEQLFIKIGDTVVDGSPLRDHVIDGVSVFHIVAQQVFTEAKKYQLGEWEPALRRAEAPWYAFLVSGWFLLITTISVLLGWRSPLIVFGMESATAGKKKDFRMSVLWESISRHSIRALSMLHVVPSRKTAARALGRGLLVLYLEAFDIFFTTTTKAHVIDISGFTEDEALFVQDLIPRFLHLSQLVRFRARVWGTILKVIGPRRVVLIDDGRHQHSLVWACERAHIPTTLYQHGHYTKYHVGMRSHRVSGRFLVPNELVVWSDYWKHAFIALNGIVPEHQISVAKKQVVLSVTYDPQAPILIPFESEGPRKEIGAMMLRMKDRIVFKLRDDVPEQEQLSIYGLSKGDVVTQSKIPEKVSGAVGMYSTLLYDLVAAGIPVGVLMELSDFGEALVVNGLGEVVSHTDGDGIVRTLSQVSQSTREERQARLTTCSGDLDSVMESW